MRRSALTITTLAAIAALLGCSDSELPTATERSPVSPLLGTAEFEAPAGAFYGPETFARKRGKPVLEERTVALEGYGAPYTLYVRNGDADGGSRVSSGEVYADGERVLGPADFSPGVDGFAIPLEASGSLTLGVELRGGPGSELTVWVAGVAVLAGEPDPTTSTVEVSTPELPADGASTATATVSLHDADGVPIGTGGHDISFEITPINENTPGATIAEVIDNGDGTYSATIVPPVNNGTGTLVATIPSSASPASSTEGASFAVMSQTASSATPVDTVGTVELTYTGGNNVPVMEPLVISTPEDVVTEVVLPGSDPDGDPLTWHIEARYFRNGFSDDTRYTDASGDTVIPSGLAGWQPLDLDLTDNTLYYHPQPDGYLNGLAMLLVSVSDGLGTSASDTVRIDVFSVNDAPRLTLEGDLVLYEDTHLDFAMRGDDPEMDRFNVKFVVPPLPRGFLVHHHFTGDVIVSGQTTLQSSSDQSAGWPMTFTPTANDFDDVYYNEFSYVLEEVNTGLRSPEARVNIRVLPVNDAPVLDIDGIGTAQNHDLAATLIAGVAYTVPALAVDDEEVVNSGGVSGEGDFDVTIEMVGAGRIYLPPAVKQDYEDAWVEFEETNESVTFSMPYDVTDQGFVSGLTIDRLISSLVYLPRSAGTETLTITIGDGGVGGSCEPGPMTDDYYAASPGADLDRIPGPCVKTSVTTIQIDVQDVEEGGTRPEDGTVMSLTQGGA